MAERLPNANEARIDPRKLRDYVLNADFPELVTIVPANRPKESEDESV